MTKVLDKSWVTQEGTLKSDSLPVSIVKPTVIIPKKSTVFDWEKYSVAGVTIEVPEPPLLISNTIPAQVKHFIRSLEVHEVKIATDTCLRIIHATYIDIKPDMNGAVTGAISMLRQQTGVSQFSSNNEDIIVDDNTLAVKSISTFNISGYKISHVGVIFFRGFESWQIAIIGMPSDVSLLQDRVINTIRFSP